MIGSKTIIKWRSTLTPCLIVSCLFVSCLLVSCLLVPCLLVSCLFVSSRFVSFRVFSYRVFSCRVFSCRVFSFRVFSCRVLSQDGLIATHDRFTYEASPSPFLPNPLRLASDSIEPVGSEPMDRKQMSRVRESLSSHVASKFRITLSAYLSPIVSAMYFRACGNVRSGHHDLRTNTRR